MRRLPGEKWLAGSAVLVTLAALALGVQGQDAEDRAPRAIPLAPAAAKPPKGRLPHYFNEVVSEAQRQKIYAIQAQYTARIETLETQIEQLKLQQTAEIEAVLSPQQLAKVRERIEESKRKKAAPK